MPNIKTAWSYEHWREIELLSNELIGSIHDMNERIGSGGGNNKPDDLINSALRSEALLARIKVVASKYG